MRASQLARLAAGPSATVAVVYFAIGACGGASSPSPPPPTATPGPYVPAPSVTIAAATSEDVPVSLELAARLEPRTLAHATAPRAGTISTLMHGIGDVVHRGDAVAAVQPDHGRAANASAPIDGVVLAVPVHLGDHVDAHAELASIGDVAGVVVHADVPADRAAMVRPGQPIELEVASMPNRVFQSAVSRIAPAADAQGAIPIEAPVENADGSLHPGEPARLRVTLATHAGAVVVPAEAVVNRGGVQAVMVAQGGYAHLREVAVGERLGERVELVSGVRAGEDVVLSPGALADGAQITPR